jgi:hypothetical protein
MRCQYAERKTSETEKDRRVFGLPLRYQETPPQIANKAMRTSIEEETRSPSEHDRSKSNERRRLEKA